MAHWSGIGIPKTNAIALEVSYTHDSRGSHDSVDGREDAVEMGNLSRNQKRRMKSMGIMLGDDFLEEQRDGTCCNSNNNKYWYVWLCCTIAVVCAILATDGALQYRKEAALLHGYGENGDDYNAEECRVYDQQTLGIVEQHLAHANDTATFCQADVSTILYNRVNKLALSNLKCFTYIHNFRLHRS